MPRPLNYLPTKDYLIRLTRRASLGDRTTSSENSKFRTIFSRAQGKVEDILVRGHVQHGPQVVQSGYLSGQLV